MLAVGGGGGDGDGGGGCGGGVGCSGGSGGGGDGGGSSDGGGGGGGSGGSKRAFLSSVRRNGWLAPDGCRLTAAATWCHKKVIYGSPPLPTSGKNSQPGHRAMSALVAGLTAKWTASDDYI